MHMGIISAVNFLHLDDCSLRIWLQQDPDCSLRLFKVISRVLFLLFPCYCYIFLHGSEKANVSENDKQEAL